MNSFRLLACYAVLVLSSSLIAQVRVSENAGEPVPSAMLEVESATRGFLPPRMTTDQRDAISLPAEGLMIYNVDLKCMQFNIGSPTVPNWICSDGSNASNPPCPQGLSVGDNYGGGTVAYVGYPGTTCGYLISSTADQHSTAWPVGNNWGCSGTLIGTSLAIGTGKANSDAILAACSTPNTAVRVCDELVLNGFTDWFLPSLNELNEMHTHRELIGGFSPVGYYPSSEVNATNAYEKLFDTNGTIYTHLNKGSDYRYVRCVRAF